MALPDGTLRVIMSGYDEAKAKFAEMSEEEAFTNGFLFGMRFGLGLTLPHKMAGDIMSDFMGEARHGKG